MNKNESLTTEFSPNERKRTIKELIDFMESPEFVKFALKMNEKEMKFFYKMQKLLLDDSVRMEIMREVLGEI